MNISEIRYNNVRGIVKDVGGVTALAEKLDKSQAQVSSFAGSNPKKSIGNKVAREIEVAFCLANGWMDKDHTEDTETVQIISHLISDFSSVEVSELIAQIEIIKRRRRGDFR